MDVQPAYCKIVLAGPLNRRWADYLGDMLMNIEVQDGLIQTTTMIGQPRDLQAYIGILSAIANLGFTLIATEYQPATSLEAAASHRADPTYG
jgi:hypothetical protein